tara:strand:+ start:3085 stop:3450 length:366 start_codon:yes stop_codon:yes gene_type:complete
MKTIDITPSRKGYASCLQAVIQGSTNAEDVAWAKEELTKLNGKRKRKTILHVNQHHIKANAKGAELPVLTVKDYKQNRRCNRAIIRDKNGEVVAKLIYSPDKPLSCGAKVWIETELEVETT